MLVAQHLLCLFPRPRLESGRFGLESMDWGNALGSEECF